MPKAPRRCSQAGCRQLQPCRRHPRGWASSKSLGLPSNWKSLCRAVRSRDRDACQLCGRVTQDGSVDHVIPRSAGGGHELGNLRYLCTNCHNGKTHEESERGKRR